MNQRLEAPYFPKDYIARRVKDMHDGYFKLSDKESRLLGINFDSIYEEFIRT